MNKTLSKIIFGAIPAGFLIPAFMYILFIIHPELIFHHVQPPFIASPDFFYPFLKYPGGPAELLANLFMQLFYFKLAGTVALLAIAFTIGWLMCLLMDSVYKSGVNCIWALVPVLVTIALANNYNFPFSIVISVAFLLLLLLILSKTGKGIILSFSVFTLGAIAVYWFAGSGNLLLFCASALFVSTPLKGWEKAAFIVFIPVFGFIFPLLAYNFLFAVSLKHQYFWFYAPKAWFMRFEPSAIFIFYLVSIPVLLAAAKSIAIFRRRKTTCNPKPGVLILKIVSAFSVILAIAFLSHFATFNSDAKKVVEADYYCYYGNAEKTAKAATTLKDYNFAANLSYNLAMSKTGRLTENFFSFFQIKGTEALHPDIEFASELSFIASDFYYDLGFISEARHWAYESLVFYPYSPRALKNLVKIHLVTGEYKAAERTLNILSKGLVNKNFVSEFSPYIADTSLISSNLELMEKRSFIPAEGKLSPSIKQRFRTAFGSQQQQQNRIRIPGAVLPARCTTGEFFNVVPRCCQILR